MQITKLSAFDRLVNIQQLAETTTIKRINKRLLQEQVISNLELDRLNQQLSQANAINRQILENQIRELEHRETQKHYKDLSFKVRELTKAISQISEPLVKCYFINKHYEILQVTASIAEKNLEEINDRVFNSTTIENIDDIKQDSIRYLKEYNLSPLSQIDESINELNNLKKQSAKQLPPPHQAFVKVKFKSKVNLSRIFGLIIFGLLTMLFFIAFINTVLTAKETDFLIISTIFLMAPLAIFLLILRKEVQWRKNYSVYIGRQNQFLQSEITKQNSIKDEYRIQVGELDKAISNHTSHTIYIEIIERFPNFENTVIIISELYDRCFPATNNLKNVPNKPLLKKAAEIVVKHQQCSNSLLQRKLAIGNSQANKLINQLEILGIVDLAEGGRSYSVLITDDVLLNEKLGVL